MNPLFVHAMTARENSSPRRGTRRPLARLTIGRIASIALAAALANGCGGGSSIGSGGAGLEATALWEQPRRSVLGGAIPRGEGEIPPASGFGPELPASVRTVRFVFQSESGYSCCLAVDPRSVAVDPATGQRRIVLRPLPTGSATVAIAGFPGARAVAPAGVETTCPTDPGGTGSDCAANVFGTPSFASEAEPVLLVPGEISDAGDIAVSSLPFLIEDTLKPPVGGTVSSPVSVDFTVVDASEALDAGSIDATILRDSTALPVAIELEPCDDASPTAAACSSDRALEVSGFRATGVSSAAQGGATLRIEARNLGLSPSALDTRFDFTVEGSEPIATATPTRSVGPSATASLAPSATASPTSSASPAPTETQTANPSDTASATPTPTERAPTASATASLTPTPSATGAETPTPTPTPTSLDRLTPTPTASPTPPETATPSFTPSATRTLGPSDTPTETATAAESPTPTETETPEPTETATPTSSATHTATETPTDTATAAPSATATDTPAPPTATPTHTPTEAPTSTPTETATQAPTGTPTPTPTATSTAASFGRVGQQFLVNAYTVGLQLEPAVASDADGDFVVAWIDLRAGYDSSVLGRRYASDGTPRGDSFQVSSYTTVDYTFPEVWADADGDFVVAWEQSYVEATYRAVRAKRYDSAGAEQFALVVPEARDPAVSGESNGDFVLVWREEYIGYSSVFGRLYASAGAPIGSEFRVSSYSGQAREYAPSVAADADGDFVVVWENRQNFTDSVLGRRFASSGAPLGTDFQVSALTTGYEYAPRVGSDPAGNFVVTWDDIVGDVGDFIRMRGFASDGSQRFAETGIGLGAFPDVAVTQDGSFVIAWTGFDGGFLGIVGRRFASAGNALGSQFVVNAFTPYVQFSGRVSAGLDGKYVVVWESQAEDGDLDGIFGQRLAPQ